MFLQWKSHRFRIRGNATAKARRCKHAHMKGKQHPSAASGGKQKPRSLRRPSDRDRLSILMSFLFRRISNTHRRAAKCPPSVFMYSFEQRRSGDEEDQSFHVVVDNKCHVAVPAPNKLKQDRNDETFPIPCICQQREKKARDKKGTSFRSACEKCAVHNLSCRAARMHSDSKEARGGSAPRKRVSLVSQFVIRQRNAAECRAP